MSHSQTSDDRERFQEAQANQSVDVNNISALVSENVVKKQPAANGGVSPRHMRNMSAGGQKFKLNLEPSQNNGIEAPKLIKIKS